MSPDMPDGIEDDGPQEPPWDGVGHRPLPPEGEQGAHTAFMSDENEEES